MKAILTFHSIDNSGSVLSFPPKLLIQLLENLRNAQIPILSFDDLFKTTTEKGVALTFDDGMRSVFTEALPILKNYAAPAHIFITSDLIDGTELWPPAGQVDGTPSFEMLNWDEVEQLQNANVSIEAHTRTHPDVRQLTRSQLIEECEHCNECIEQHTGRRPKFFAYPFGYHNLHARECVGNIYEASVTTELRYLNTVEDYTALPRLDSYYLKPSWIQRGLQKYTTHSYMRLRWLLRTIKALAG